MTMHFHASSVYSKSKDGEFLSIPNKNEKHPRTVSENIQLIKATELNLNLDFLYW